MSKSTRDNIIDFNYQGTLPPDDSDTQSSDEHDQSKFNFTGKDLIRTAIQILQSIHSLLDESEESPSQTPQKDSSDSPDTFNDQSGHPDQDWNEAWTDGYQSGRKQGFEAGYKKGISDAENQIMDQLESNYLSNSSRLFWTGTLDFTIEENLDEREVEDQEE